MKIEQALSRSRTHDEIVRCEATQEEIDTFCALADGSVDLVSQYGYVDVWGTDDDGVEYRLHITPEPVKPWTYEGYWNVVLGGDRDAEGVVREFDLVPSNERGLDEWLGVSEAASWQAGGHKVADGYPEEWTGFHVRALAELVAVAEAEES